MLQNLSSAAVVIGALRVNYSLEQNLYPCLIAMSTTYKDKSYLSSKPLLPMQTDKDCYP